MIKDDFKADFDNDLEDILLEDPSVYCPKCKDIVKVLNNELKKPEFARMYLLTKGIFSKDEIYKIVPMSNLGKDNYIFKVEGKLKKLNINKLEFSCKK